jgi:penicillin-binding protein 2
MRFHPNDIQRRSRAAAGVLFLAFLFLLGSFFRAQVVMHARYLASADENRLREVPLPAPRGLIRDRKGAVIAENIPGYSVSILASKPDSLRAVLQRVGQVVPMTPEQADRAMRQFRQYPNQPAQIFASASFDIVSRLEEHRPMFPGLIILETPKRYYPDGAGVAALVGYTGEVSEEELETPRYAGYKPRQQVGKGGIEYQYESRLKGRDGVRYVEVDARGRVVRDANVKSTMLPPEPAEPLITNIDMDLQRFVASIFGDSLEGAAVALDPVTGDVLALHSAPMYDPNRFIGGISASYYKQLREDPRLPLMNKATQGLYPPGSTWKLATSLTALELGIVKMDERQSVPCAGGYQYGNRYFKCHLARGHGSLTLAGAIEQSCDVYFYQLGLKLGLQRMIAGGLRLGGGKASGVDLPNDKAPDYPTDPVVEYMNKKWGVGRWSQGNGLSLAIGQGENSQTVISLAKFYTALATNGVAATPRVVRGQPVRDTLFRLDSATAAQLQDALAGVVARGTAQSSRIQGTVLAGKTGTAQSNRFRNGVELDHAWFAGYAPADNPKIVVAVMLEFGGHGTRAARIASRIIDHYLKTTTATFIKTEGD